MRASVMAMTLVLVVGFAFAGASDTDLPAENRVKLYYGTIGSDDYIWGTTSVPVQTDAWMYHSEMPASLMDVSAAATETHGYVFFGYNTAHPRVLARHAVGSTTWETLAQPPQELCNGNGAIVDDTIFYVSGYTYGEDALVDTLWKYSISGDDWTSAPGPFTGTTYNWEPLVVACEGKVYSISGCNQPGATNPTREVYAYTPGAGWARVADMNQGSVFAAGWCYDGKIYVAGGNYNGSGITRTEFYDPVADTWIIDASTFPQLPYATWGPAGGVVGATGYVAGGVVGSALTDSVAYFDHNTNTWSVGTEGLILPVYRTAGAGNADGKAVVYGGSMGGFTPCDTVQYEQLATGNAHDVGPLGIVAPGAIITPGPVQPTTRIKNYGENAEGGFDVTFKIDSAGTEVYNETQTFTGPIDPGATENVTFPSWTAVGGTYDLTTWTSLSNDENRSNDTMMGRSTVMRYTVEWENKSPIVPCPVSRCGAAAIMETDDWKVHVICGNCQTHTSHPNDEIYDVSTNSWSTGLTHPAGGGMGVHNHDAVETGDVIWVGGGSSGSSAYYNNLTKLDIGGGSWTSATAMPQSNLLYYELCAYPDSGWVYCFGGSPSGGNPTQACFKYDPGTNQWTPMTQMPEPRRNPMAVYVPPDTIYVIGGMSTSGYTDTRGTVWKYSVMGNTWTNMGADSMADNLGWGKAELFDDGFDQRIYILGGYRRGTITNVCWRYDLASGTWSDDRNMLASTRSHGAAITQGVMWVTGGFGAGILNNMQEGTITGVGIGEGKRPAQQPTASTQTFVRDLGRVNYVVGSTGRVNLSVYDINGSLVRTLVDGVIEAGRRTATWNRTDNNGSRVASGTYFYRLTVGDKVSSTKAVVVD